MDRIQTTKSTMQQELAQNWLKSSVKLSATNHPCPRAQQQHRSWLQTDEVLYKLIYHPLLSKQDFTKIQATLKDMNLKQISYGLGCTCITMLFYSFFLRRKPFFMNFFNHRQSYMLARGFKKTFATYFVFLAWIYIFRDYFEKQIPSKLKQQGYYKKYGILYSE